MPQPQPADDPLRDLRDRIDETRRAAERVAGDVPPQGWASPSEARQAQDELETIAGLVRALRDLVPPELRTEVNEVLRSVLLLLRAVIDQLVERLGEEQAAPGAPAAPRPVQDIPIA